MRRYGALLLSYRTVIRKHRGYPIRTSGQELFRYPFPTDSIFRGIAAESCHDDGVLPLKGTAANANGQALRACIVGSGPAGFYLTKYLLKETGLGRDIAIDILEKLPTPFGLVRSGVAPDHPEVKAVQKDFEQELEASRKEPKSVRSDAIFSKWGKKIHGNLRVLNLHFAWLSKHLHTATSPVASDPRVHFFGNVCVGRDVLPEKLSQLYDIVVLAYGAAGDRELRVPGAELKGVFTARAFVSWYNGHPDFAGMSEQVHAALKSSDTVAVIGVGNVALDCARVLAKGVDVLRNTDICDHALDVLASVSDSLRRVVVLGRRGHVQASFTIKELRDLTKLDGVACVVRNEELKRGRTPASLEEIKAQRPKARIDTLLTKVSEGAHTVPLDAKMIELRFLTGPTEILPSESSLDRVGGIRISRNRLELDPATGSELAVDSGEEGETIPCGMVLGSIGYRCLPMAGVPYNDRFSVIANDGGRVADTPGMYCSGWARRGPSGIIGTNISDAKAVVAAIVEDVRNERLDLGGHKEGRSGLLTVLKEELKYSSGGNLMIDSATEIPLPKVVDWEGYKRIDDEEVARGMVKNKPREKVVSIDEMLDIAHRSSRA